MAIRKATDTAQLKVRLKEKLRAALANSAKAKGVSLNAEVVSRLGVSFDLETMALKALVSWLGGPDNTQFHLALAHEIRKCGDRPLRELLADPATYERLQVALLETLELWRRDAQSPTPVLNSDTMLRGLIKITPEAGK